MLCILYLSMNDQLVVTELVAVMGLVGFFSSNVVYRKIKTYRPVLIIKLVLRLSSLNSKEVHVILDELLIHKISVNNVKTIYVVVSLHLPNLRHKSPDLRLYYRVYCILFNCVFKSYLYY